ncbi:MAG: NAD(P)/FAD-dependent oxidoreductase [Clostridia bacterium]|nr:NAD(P)/FAD-dependent oxidoreductase [Clostridia bacterium]
MKIAVIGGGAAGMTAAGFAAQNGASVILFEKNERYGAKLRITGKGRCNVTNNCTKEEFFDNVVSNPRFLYSSYSKFDCAAVMDFFESLGVPLKTERGNRVFPASDKAADIADALIKFCRDGKVKTLNEKVCGVEFENGGFTVITSRQKHSFDKVIIATGGLSYPRTGSTGDGYAFARSLGHSVTELSASLVPLVCREDICGKCRGLSLKNVKLTATDNVTGKTVYEEQGEMLFTENGVSGPLVLSASAHMDDESGRYGLFIDLKPALDIKTLDKRILRDFSDNKNKDVINAFSALLPSKLIEPFVDLTGIPHDKKVNSVTASERERIVRLLKRLPLTVKSKAPIDEAVITRGGVDTKQIDPKTMQSKLIPGLYFAGEVIDCDAYTGGFNLQISFCTGHTAGISASE